MPRRRNRLLKLARKDQKRKKRILSRSQIQNRRVLFPQRDQASKKDRPLKCKMNKRNYKSVLKRQTPRCGLKLTWMDKLLRMTREGNRPKHKNKPPPPLSKSFPKKNTISCSMKQRFKLRLKLMRRAFRICRKKTSQLQSWPNRNSKNRRSFRRNCRSKLIHWIRKDRRWVEKILKAWVISVWPRPWPTRTRQLTRHKISTKNKLKIPKRNPNRRSKISSPINLFLIHRVLLKRAHFSSNFFKNLWKRIPML